MNYAVIVYRDEYGSHDGTCDAIFKYREDACHFAEHIYNLEAEHTRAINLQTGEVVCEFET